MKIKVLHVVLSMETGGLENGIVNLVNHADSDKFYVDVLCLRAKGELADRIVNPDSQVLFDGNEDHSLLTAIKKIFNACKSGQYHIVHSHGFTTMLASFIAGKLAGGPCIVNGEHGTLYHSSTKHRLIQKYLFRKMDINLTVSEELKREILEQFNLKYDNFRPIINGVDTNKFITDSVSNILLRNQLGLSPDDIVIGSVGRLVEVKNYKSLVSAFSKLSVCHSNVHLVLAGDGSERSNIEEQILINGLSSKVHLLGRRDDIPQIMNLLDIFVLPSFSEGLSNTLLEAMSCGTPVVASDVGGNKEIIIENITGFLYQSDNVDDLYSILDSLSSKTDRVRRLSKQSREHILANYSLSGMVDQYETVYTELLTQYDNKRVPQRKLS
jgi:sugar transferase (PEP-CTERM/EpsH1 system associated)